MCTFFSQMTLVETPTTTFKPECFHCPLAETSKTHHSDFSTLPRFKRVYLPKTMKFLVGTFLCSQIQQRFI